MKRENIKYRIKRARETYQDALYLFEKGSINSSVNRLYYSAYYGVMALLLDIGVNPTTHNGAKSNFSKYFIKTAEIPMEFGKIYFQLFTWRQKGDYDDLFDFDKSKVEPYFEPVKALIEIIEKKILK